LEAMRAADLRWTPKAMKLNRNQGAGDKVQGKGVPLAEKKLVEVSHPVPCPLGKAGETIAQEKIRDVLGQKSATIILIITEDPRWTSLCKQKKRGVFIDLNE